MADVVSDSQTWYAESIGAMRQQRDQIAEDLAFSDPSDPQQWDIEDKRRRESDPGGSRPCLVFDQLGQYVANVAGQVEQRPPALHTLPVGDGDKRCAEQQDGIFRHIEHVSRAQQHYARALTAAARAGVGYLTLRPEYVDRALGYQEPRIGSEGDPLRVVIDPWSVEIDGCDATRGVILTPWSNAEFKRKWPKAELASYGEEDHRRKARDERESIVVAEEWTIEDAKANIVMFLDNKGDEQALPEDDFWQARQRGQVVQVTGNRTDKTRRVWWRQMSGAEVLETCKDKDGKEAPYPADGIGIIPVYGYVGWAGGRMTYCGIPRRARAAQQAYNYHMSEARAYMATAPKSPWITPIRAIRGLEKLWDAAAAESRAYLPYRDLDEEGPIASPQRAPLSVDLRMHVQGAEQAKSDIQGAIGMYQANLGAPSNETSGVAIDSRKQQGEASTAHFPSHMAASIAYLGKLTLQMAAKLIDTKRQQRILGIDGTHGVVTINPGQPEAVQETDTGLSINLNIGSYDTRVVVGAAFATQRTQAQQAFTEMMRNNPSVAPVIMPFWAQVQDIPHADKMAQVFTAMAPPEVQAILNPDAAKQPKTADLINKVNQLQQALQEAIAHAHAAQQDADAAKQAAEDKSEEEARLAYEAETKRMIGLKDAISPQDIQALVVQTLETMMRQPDPLGNEQPGPEAWQPAIPMHDGSPMDGPGPDGSPMHEQAESPQFEQMEGPEAGEGMAQ